MSGVQIVDDVLTPQEVNTLLEYIYVDDHRTDDRHDFRTKHPRWDIDSWPQEIIQGAMDRLLGSDYRVAEVDVLCSRVPLKMHVDAVSKRREDLHWAIMFTLRSVPEGYTVFFDNYWLGHGRNAHFTQQPWSPFTQKFQTLDGTWKTVSDIREFLVQCENDPSSITDMAINQDFIDYLRVLIDKRSRPWIPPEERDEDCFAVPEPRFNEYARELTNYDPKRKFPRDVWERYLQHQPYEDFHGLALDCVMEHQPGRAAFWHRSQVHCSSHNHSLKEMITVFTEHV